MAKRAKAAKSDFHRQTVLFRWALNQLGVDDLEEFKDRFQIGPDTADGTDERTGLHCFFEAIAAELPKMAGRVIPLDRLQSYEQNILEHTQAINTARFHHGQLKIDWKYHQYLALLFTEMYLDRYFRDPVSLREELNAHIIAHNAERPADAVEPFSTAPTNRDDGDPRRQLALLAFWCATGSGKTLLMHMHIRQFRHYQERAYKAGLWPKLDQIILVTPNDGLSTQHERELKQSGLDAVSIGELGTAGLFKEQARQAIKILSIHKFREEHGETTVATEAFEGCNLVLVDEGHRGAGAGGEGAWLSRRNQLAEGGFTFEYSATFKEGISGISKPAEREEMRNRYARAILFDYAYRSFYRDGYGKDFRILNLEDGQAEKQRRYLTAALMLFYQQLRVWADGGAAIKPFHVKKPLWVFVGHTVTGGKASTTADKVSVSDVMEVLLFLKGFLADQKSSVALVESLLTEGLRDHKGQDLLERRLPHLKGPNDDGADAQSVYEGILRDVFNAPGGGSLTVQLLKAATGEMAVKVGEANPFGVVNVGDPATVAERCDKEGITRLEDDVNRPSLFLGIDHDDSPINLLVGSRKFTEGWNSYRVSSIGLMGMGKNEGTQVIQLFGRGVRLRGYRNSLRRSSVLADKPAPPPNFRQVETLQVFGVKAKYLETFRKWIHSEVPEALAKETWDLPVVTTLPPERKLKTIRLREMIDGVKVERGQAFHQLGPLVRLRPPDETASADAWLRRHPTKLNWLPRIKGIVGSDKRITSAIGEAAGLPRKRLTKIPLCLFDLDELVFDLEAFKAARGLDRLHVDRAAVVSLLERDDWYELYASEEDMRLDRYENRAQWQRMALQLLSAYAERFYRFVRGRWESPYIEVAEVTADDPSIIDAYTIETTDRVYTEEDLKRIDGLVKDLRAAVAKESLAAWSKCGGRWRTVPFAGHLYQPLLFVGKNVEIRISPVALDKWEAQFVKDLAGWCKANKAEDIYLLRNQAVRGLGFFQAANFYPDFLLWMQDEDCEHLAFIDPKGLHHYGPADPKVQFATQDVPQLQKVVAAQSPGLRLHAYILCNTPYAKLEWPRGDGQLMSREEVEQFHVLFQQEDDPAYLAELMERIRPGPACV